MRKREFETDRGTLRYWVSENDEETAQLVFLPGLTADHRLFDKQVDCFAQRARCLVWDPPSHGESRPFSLDWSLDDLALMLEQILSREGFERPILVGQSMGGYVSQAFIRLFPDRACGFVSVDSCPLDRSYYTAIELWALKHGASCPGRPSLRNRHGRSAVETCAAEYPAAPCHARRFRKVRSAYRCWSSAHGRRGLKDSISTQCRFRQARRRTGLSRASAPSDKKIAGGQPPAPGSPSFRKNQSYFLIGRGFMQSRSTCNDARGCTEVPNEKPLTR